MRKKNGDEIFVGSLVELDDPRCPRQHGCDRASSILGIVIFASDPGLLAEGWAEGWAEVYALVPSKRVMSEGDGDPIIAWSELAYPEQPPHDSGLHRDDELGPTAEPMRSSDSVGLELPGPARHITTGLRYPRPRGMDVEAIECEIDLAGGTSGVDRAGYRPVRYHFGSTFYSSIDFVRIRREIKQRKPRDLVESARQIKFGFSD